MQLWRLRGPMTRCLQSWRPPESQWWSSSPNLKAWEPGLVELPDASPRAWGPERWCPSEQEKMGVPAWQRVIHLSPHFSHSGPQWIGWCPPSIGEGDLFHQFNSNANLFQVHLTDIFKHNVLPLSEFSWVQSSYIMKLTITLTPKASNVWMFTLYKGKSRNILDLEDTGWVKSRSTTLKTGWVNEYADAAAEWGSHLQALCTHLDSRMVVTKPFLFRWKN